MARNRRHSKRMDVMIGQAGRLLSVIVLLFAAVIVNILAKSSNEQQRKAIGDKERTLARLEDERVRASARWDEMMSSENLDRALLRHGLAMRYPRADQAVRMLADGAPDPRPSNLAALRRGAARRPVAAKQSPRKSRR